MSAGADQRKLTGMPDGAPIILSLIAVGGAGFVTGLTGFGFALVSVPLLLLVMDPASTVTTVLVIGQATSTVNALTSRRHVESAMLRWLLPGAIPGLIAGSYALRWVDPVLLKLVAATLVVAFTAVLALGQPQLMARRQRRARTSLIGGASGLLATSVGLSGPPIVLLLSAVQPDKDRSRATLAAYFATTGPFGLAALLLQRSTPAHAWAVALLLVPVALVGRALGSRTHHRTPQRAFRMLTLSITLVAGLGGIASALASLLAHG
ncbi:MAG: sulfite exporter TauE/SafE family protein [Deinococcales bacterium]